MVEDVHGVRGYILTWGTVRPLDNKQERALKSPFVIISITMEYL